MSQTERRSKENYRIRVYFDAIQQAQGTTDQEWLNNWIHSNTPWVSRQEWINRLERCILNETKEIYSIKRAS